MAIELTVEALKSAEFKGPVAFYDGRNGWARQDFECVLEPRFGYAWQRENRDDRGRQHYMVDGDEVPSLEVAVNLLSLAPNPQSAAQVRRQGIEEFRFSPKLNYGATRALSEARCNADVAPFGMQRAWMRRADHAWHVGINAWAETQRQAGVKFEDYRWLYNVKHAAHETYRLIYLFARDRKEDTGLECALGTRCRDCPILQQIERSMIEARSRRPFPQDIEDADIDAVKVQTCIGHILTQNIDPLDGAFLWTAADKKDGFM